MTKIKRSEQLKFHIKNKEYFMQLATSLNMIEQSAERFGWDKTYSQKIKKIINDLCYLDQEYNILKKKGANKNNTYNVSQISISRIS